MAHSVYLQKALHSYGIYTLNITIIWVDLSQ